MTCNFLSKKPLEIVPNSPPRNVSSNLNKIFTHPKNYEQYEKYLDENLCRLLEVFHVEEKSLTDEDRRVLNDFRKDLLDQTVSFIRTRLKITDRDVGETLLFAHVGENECSIPSLKDWLEEAEKSKSDNDLIINTLLLIFLKLSSTSYYSQSYVMCNAYSTQAVTLIRLVRQDYISMSCSKLVFLWKYLSYYVYVAKIFKVYATCHFYMIDHQETCHCLNDFGNVWRLYGKLMHQYLPSDSTTSNDIVCPEHYEVNPKQISNEELANVQNSNIVSPVSGESTDCNIVSPVSGESTDSSRVSPVSGESTDSSRVSPVSGESTDGSRVSPVSGESTDGSRVSPVSGESTESTRVSPVSGESTDSSRVSPVSGESTDSLSIHGETRKIDNTPDDRHFNVESKDDSPKFTFDVDFFLKENLDSQLLSETTDKSPFDPMAKFDVNKFSDSEITPCEIMRNDYDLLGKYTWLKVSRSKSNMKNLVKSGLIQSKEDRGYLKINMLQLSKCMDFLPPQTFNELPYKMLVTELENAMALLIGSSHTKEREAVFQTVQLETKKNCSVFNGQIKTFCQLYQGYSVLIQMTVPQIHYAIELCGSGKREEIEALISLCLYITSAIDLEFEYIDKMSKEDAPFTLVSMLLKISILLPLEVLVNVRLDDAKLNKYETIFNEKMANNFEALTTVIAVYVDFTYNFYCEYFSWDGSMKNPELQLDYTLKRLLFLKNVIEKYDSKLGTELDQKFSEESANELIEMLRESTDPPKNKRKSGKVGKSKKSRKLKRELNVNKKKDSVKLPNGKRETFVIDSTLKYSIIVDTSTSDFIKQIGTLFDRSIYKDFKQLNDRENYSKEIKEVLKPDLIFGQPNTPLGTLYQNIIPFMFRTLMKKREIYKSYPKFKDSRTLFTKKQVEKAISYLQKNNLVYTDLENDLLNVLRCLRELEKCLTFKWKS